ncbi:MAG: hypothetical protein ABIO04_10340 [Ferruginibacter sp.]
MTGLIKSISIIACVFICTTCFASIAPNLTAEYKKNKKTVELKWQNTDPAITKYVLQRSDDNHYWKDIYSLKADDFKKKKQEKFSDHYPATSKNYYRLKIFTSTNEFEVTVPIMVIIGSPASSWILYPVPVKTVLNLQYNGSEAIRGVVSIFIQTLNGYVLIKKRYSSLNRTIQVPVENLGRGIYDIRIVINDKVVWNQRFIK